MAAVLRSSVGQTVRRAFSGEGTLSVRALHTAGRNNPRAYASHAKQNLKPSEVDPLLKKIDGVARKGLVVRYTERLVRELSPSIPFVLGRAVECFLIISGVGAYMLGYQVGCNESLARKGKASSGKQA